MRCLVCLMNHIYSPKIVDTENVLNLAVRNSLKASQGNASVMEERASSVSSLVAPNMLKGDAQGNASVMEGLTSSVSSLVAPKMLKAS